MQHTSLKKERIDWDRVHARLQTNARALEESLTPTAERIDAAYRRRAVDLAKTQKQDLHASVGLPVLLFRLGQERYALEVKHLAEVLPFGYCVAVPRSPAQFLGVMNVRGELRVVIDLRQLLAPSGEPASDSGFVLMLRPGVRQEQIGLKVDSIEELRQIPAEGIAPPTQGSFVTPVSSLALLSVEAVLASVFSNHEFSGESLTK